MSTFGWITKLVGLVGQVTAKQAAVSTAPVGTSITLAQTGHVKVEGREGDLQIVYVVKK